MAKLTNEAFNPEVGKCYELHYGQVTYNGQKGYLSARIRVDGTMPKDWIDLDTNAPLDRAIGIGMVPLLHREIDCS